MGLFNRNKAEKEAKRVMDKQESVMKKLRDEKTLQDIGIKDEVLREEEQRIKDLDFHHRINTAKSRLTQLNDKFTVKLGMELNNLKQLQDTGRTDAIRKSMQRVKNYYYTLVVIYRSKERLYDIESDYEWSKTMGELSNTFKLMNKITSGYEPIKKILFRIRMKRGEIADKTEYSKLSGYYGKKIDNEVNKDTVDVLSAMDPMDMLVSDDLVNMIMNDSSSSNIISNIERGVGVTIDPSSVVNEVCDANKEAADKGEEPIDPDISPEPKYTPHTDDEISKMFDSL